MKKQNMNIRIVIFFLLATWNLGAQENPTLVIQENHADAILKIAAHAEKDLVATADEYNVKIWDSRSWKILFTIPVFDDEKSNQEIFNLEFQGNYLFITTAEIATDFRGEESKNQYIPETRKSSAIDILNGERLKEMGKQSNLLLLTADSLLLSIREDETTLYFRVKEEEKSFDHLEGNFKYIPTSEEKERSWFLRARTLDNLVCITFAKFSPNNSFLVCGYSEGTIELKDPNTFKTLGQPIRTDLSQVTDVHFVGDTLLILEGLEKDNELVFFDLDKKEIVNKRKIPCDGEVCNYGIDFHRSTGWLAIVNQLNRIYLTNIFTKEVKYINCPFQSIHDIAFLANGRDLMITGQPRQWGQSPILNYNLITNSFIKIPNILFDDTESIGFDATGDAIYALNSELFVKWSLKSLDRIQTEVAKERSNDTSTFTMGSRGTFLQIPPSYGRLILVRGIDQQATTTAYAPFLIDKEDTERIVGLVDKKFLVTAMYDTNDCFVYALNSKEYEKKIYSFQIDSETDFLISDDGLWLVYFQEESADLKIVNTNSWQEVFTFPIDRASASNFDLRKQFSFNRDNDKFTFFQERLTPPAADEIFPPSLQHIQIYQFDTISRQWKLEKKFKYDNSINLLNFGYDQATVLTTTALPPYEIQIWDWQQEKIINQLLGHQKPIKLIADHADLIFTKSADNTYRLWDKKSSKELVKILNTYDGEVGAEIILNQENYYYASRKGLDMVAYQIGDKGYPFEQLDLKQNRPDKVIAALPKVDSSLLEVYERAYHKRLEKMNFTEEMLSAGFNVPTVSILSKNLPVQTTKSNLTFSVEAKDEQHKLDRLNVYINDVPIYGIDGIDLRSENTQSWRQKVKLPLSRGENKIQVSALNQGGAESLKTTFSITYNTIPQLPNLYLIGISAENFPNDSLDLKYPQKDIRDFIKTYQDQTSNYSQIIVDTLHDSGVSKDALQAIKTTLNQSNVDDHVILFITGHGVLDKDLNYYFATPNMNFSQPSEGGILYQDIENLLDGIPARKKLLLMDACHSGEIDKKETVLVKNDITPKDSVTFRALDKIPQPKNIGLANSLELMKQLFVDLRRGTGATVISSAGGGEFARESKKWNNSVFTYCLLSGLTENDLGKATKKADLNGDRQITVSELQQYLAIEVPKETKGHQRPTMRIENISNDWVCWKY